MVLSFQFSVLSFEFRRRPPKSRHLRLPDSSETFFFLLPQRCRGRCSLPVVFFFWYFSDDSIRFESIVGCGVDSGLSLAAWLSDLGFRFRSSVAFPAPPRTQLKILNCLARLTVCNWSLALGSAYQLTNLPASQLPQLTSLPPSYKKNKSEARPKRELALRGFAWLSFALKSSVFRLSALPARFFN